MVGLTAAVLTDPVVWHDVECGGYDADLPVWRELAEAAGAPSPGSAPPPRIVELGCGTGRVALELAARGHQVCALDSDPALVRELAARARQRGIDVDARIADARAFELDPPAALIVLPMQVVQLMGGPEGRASLLHCARAALTPGGVLAAALADPFEGLPAEDVGPPVPDVRERDGWVYSSVPVAVRSEPGGTVIDRLRQAVSPDGRLEESMWSVRLDSLAPDELEREAEAHGFRAAGRRHVEATDDYVGSAVVLLEAV